MHWKGFSDLFLNLITVGQWPPMYSNSQVLLFYLLYFLLISFVFLVNMWDNFLTARAVCLNLCNIYFAICCTSYKVCISFLILPLRNLGINPAVYLTFYGFHYYINICLHVLLHAIMATDVYLHFRQTFMLCYFLRGNSHTK